MNFGWIVVAGGGAKRFYSRESTVAGTQWFQNAYTRRLNAKKHFWGHPSTRVAKVGARVGKPVLRKIVEAKPS